MTDRPHLNLHTHLEGNLRPETAAELAPRLGIASPDGGWAEALQLDGPADLTTYLVKVAATYPFFADADALTRIVRETVEDAAADGQDYLELRFGPGTHRGDGFSVDDVVTAACTGLAEGIASSGIRAGIVVALLRHADDDLNEEVARAAAANAGTGVVGFDLAGDESRFPDLERHQRSFGIASAAGLGLTCHAAEAGPASAVEDARRILGVTRIGHGAHLADDADAMARAADHGLVVEICPTSNWYTGAIDAIVEHPAAIFVRHGIDVVMGDDNPRQTLSALSAERVVVRDTLGLGQDGLDRIDATALRAGFMSDADRRHLGA